ncbi:MAG: hypothetical protein Q8O00_16075 [Holophaga sp.]|nr:hypothetical protein [Holophaga sp.]
MFAFLPALLLLQAPAPGLPRIEASKLPVVPGPMTPKGPDAGLEPSDPIQSQMRSQSRRSGLVPAVAVPAHSILVENCTENSVSGWKAYRVEAAAGSTVHVRLRGLHEAWFKVSCVDRWGQESAGMLQNRIPTGNPEASFRNAKAEPQTVWFVVDLQMLGVISENYTLEFTHHPAKP